MQQKQASLLMGLFSQLASDWFTAGPKYHVVSFMCHIKSAQAQRRLQLKP